MFLHTGVLGAEPNGSVYCSGCHGFILGRATCNKIHLTYNVVQPISLYFHLLFVASIMYKKFEEYEDDFVFFCTQCFLSIMYVFVEKIETLLNYFSFMTWLAIGAAVAGQLYLRWAKPDLPRPIKVRLNHCLLENISIRQNL